MSGQVKTYTWSVHDLLFNVKYDLEYYQREYRWGTEQIRELLEDLERTFLADWEDGHDLKSLLGYGRYFLGSIVTREVGTVRYLIDGQQRTTSLMLLLLFLEHLNAAQPHPSLSFHKLTSTDHYGERSWNLVAPDRTPAFEVAAGGAPAGQMSASAARMLDRYRDIEDLFPEVLRDERLPLFTYWLLHNVDVVDIRTESLSSFAVFESMNDRGAPLTEAEMLKGLLLARLEDEDARRAADRTWSDVLASLRTVRPGKEDEEIANFFRTFLRARYGRTVQTIAEGAAREDFEHIGEAYHRWARRTLDLSADAVHRLVRMELPFYVGLYVRARAAGATCTTGLEAVYCVARLNWDQQALIAYVAAVNVDDTPAVEVAKLNLVAGFIEQDLVRGAVNGAKIASRRNQWVHALVLDLRDATLDQAREKLFHRATKLPHFGALSTFRLRSNRESRRVTHHLLARLTHAAENAVGNSKNLGDYYDTAGKAWEIEHCIADVFDRYAEEFTDEVEFTYTRNLLGGLVLLQNGPNQSTGAATFGEKRNAYAISNLLSRTLLAECYQNNPAFLTWRERDQLSFRPYEDFGKGEALERLELYRQLCELVWGPQMFGPLPDTARSWPSSTALAALPTPVSKKGQAAAPVYIETADGEAMLPAQFVPSEVVEQLTKDLDESLTGYGLERAITKHYTNYTALGRPLVGLVVGSGLVKVTLRLDPAECDEPTLISLKGKGHHGVGDAALNVTTPDDLAKAESLIQRVLDVHTTPGDAAHSGQ